MPGLSQKNQQKQDICQQSKLSVQTSSAVVAYLLTWVTWWLISVGPGGSSLEMLLPNVASARIVHQSRKSIKRVQA